ncbi:hypothetical protein V8B97DRAFT_1913356 [Scleroderma yunnanense]
MQAQASTPLKQPTGHQYNCNYIHQSGINILPVWAWRKSTNMSVLICRAKAHRKLAKEPIPSLDQTVFNSGDQTGDKDTAGSSLSQPQSALQPVHPDKAMLSG